MKKIIDAIYHKIKSNYEILLIILYLLLISYLNKFPPNHIYSQYDVAQVIKVETIKNMSSMWNRASGLGNYNTTYSAQPYFMPIIALKNSLTLQSIYYYIMFLMPTFLGISYFVRRYSERAKSEFSKNKLLYAGITLAYTVSFYPVYVFFFQWGVIPFNHLYAIFPAIFILLYCYLSTQDKLQADRELYKLILVSFLVNIINNNIPYFFSLNLLIIFFCFALHPSTSSATSSAISSAIRKDISTKKNKESALKQERIADFDRVLIIKQEKKKYIQKVFKFYILFLLATFWSYFPQVSEQLRAYIANIEQENYWNLEVWMLVQSMKFPEPFIMLWDYRKYLRQLPLTVYMNFFLSITAIISVILTKTRKKLMTALMAGWIFVIFLGNKGVYWLPVEWTFAIFKLPFLAPIRSYDKTVVFLPFLIFAIITVFLVEIYKSNKKLVYAIVSVLFLSQLVASYPLWSGKLFSFYSDLHETGKDYSESTFTGLQEIPQDYHNVANILNEEYAKGIKASNDDFRVMRLPYSRINEGDGRVNSPDYWSYFPKWNLKSYDPTIQLFDMPTIQPNIFTGEDFGIWNYAEEWSGQSNKESSWLLNMASILNVRYFIYHKDVYPHFILNTIEKINYYESKGWIKKIYKGDYIDLYEIDKQFWSKHIFIPQNMIFSDSDYSKLSEILQKDKYNGETVFFKGENSLKNYNLLTNITPLGNYIVEINSKSNTKYEIEIKNITKSYVPIIFSENYHKGWKMAYITDKFLKKTNYINENNHFKANSYANGWILDVSDICYNEDGEFNYSSCEINGDGTYNIKLIVKFQPQQIYWASFAVTFSTFLWVVYKLIILYNHKVVKKKYEKI